MNKPAHRIGFFGKLPSHGDFVRRSFPAGLNKRWDQWLQSGLEASRKALRNDWLDCYLSSPIWRFCLSTGVSGNEQQWIGAMMPSVDRVGRYFPLTTITEIPSECSLFGTAGNAESWFSALEATMLTALDEDNVTAEQLEARLSSMVPLEPEAIFCVSSVDPKLADHEGCMTVRLAETARLKDAASALTDNLARRSCGGFSLWWSSGSARVVPSARIYSDLPPAELFWTLLYTDDAD